MSGVLKEYQNLIGALLATVCSVGTVGYGIWQYSATQADRLAESKRESFQKRHLDEGVYALTDAITHYGVVAINTILTVKLTSNVNPEALDVTVDRLRNSGTVTKIITGDYPEISHGLAHLDLADTPVYYVIVNGTATISQGLREIFVNDPKPRMKSNPERFLNTMYLFMVSVLSEVGAMIKETKEFGNDNAWLLENPRYARLKEACNRFRELNILLQNAGSDETSGPANALNDFMISFNNQVRMGATKNVESR